MKKHRFSKSSKKRMEGVDPRMVKVAYRALELSKVDFGIAMDGGVRTEKTQYDLYMRGLSKCDGRKKKSKHQVNEKTGFGDALDMFAVTPDGAASWGIKFMSQVACAFLQAAIELDVKIKWGGLWTGFNDMPHFELVE